MNETAVIFHMDNGFLKLVKIERNKEKGETKFSQTSKTKIVNAFPSNKNQRDKMFNFLKLQEALKVQSKEDKLIVKEQIILVVYGA